MTSGVDGIDIRDQVSEEEFVEAVDYLHGLNKYGWRLGLERFTALCERLGNPHKKLRVIHVGGTNGKGSTTAMLGSILVSAGYKVGTYFSPYVYDIRERIQVNGCLIDKASFVRLVDIVRQESAVIAETEHGHPTEFEVKTAVGFLYFAELGVDFAVLEVGLGGRLDATNVVTPLVSVITNVTLDHMDRLGNTVREIAGEKAGIIKESGHLVTASSDPEALNVLRRTCVERSSKMWCVASTADALKITDMSDADDSWSPKVLPLQIADDSVNVYGIIDDYPGVRLGMRGNFQFLNAAAAIGAIEALRKNGIPVAKEAVYKGLETAYIPARLEVLRESPMLVIDGAHNLDGAKFVASELLARFSYKRLLLVMGMVSGHSVENVIGTLAPLAQRFYATAPDNPRAASVDDVAEVARKYCPQVITVPSVKAAVDAALLDADADDLVCVTGSFYTVGEVPRG